MCHPLGEDLWKLGRPDLPWTSSYAPYFTLVTLLRILMIKKNHSHEYDYMSPVTPSKLSKFLVILWTLNNVSINL